MTTTTSDTVARETGGLYRARRDTVRTRDDGRTLYGYAAVFNEWTEIDSWEGNFLERIAPGAFRNTLRTDRDRIRVLFDHGFDPSIGNKALGKAKVIREDDTGLYVEVPLSDTSYNADLIALLRDGALDGMSFRFHVRRDEWTETDGELPRRTIKDLRLLEFGPVTWPAYEATQAGVRAQPAYLRYLDPAGSADSGTPARDSADSGTSRLLDIAGTYRRFLDNR